MVIPNSPELNDIEKRLIYELGGDIGDGPRPFADLGQKLGLSEDRVIEIILDLINRGLLRRFGATLRHQRTGFKANAMVAWLAPEERIEDVGLTLASFPEVTHCYQRRTTSDWPKNLYTMIHATSDQEIRELARRMAEKAGIEDYEILFSHEELKKTSMRYFQ